MVAFDYEIVIRTDTYFFGVSVWSVPFNIR